MILLYQFRCCYITNRQVVAHQWHLNVGTRRENLDMRFLKLFAALSALLWTTNATNDGLTDLVSWDPYSLTVNGSRVFIL